MIPIHLSAEPLTPTNLTVCLPLWGDGADYESNELTKAVERVSHLLTKDRARGRVISDAAGRVRAFGLSVFVKETVADRLVAEQRPQIGKRLIQDDRWDWNILETLEVARRNAGSGLQLVVLNQGYDDRDLPEDGWSILLGTLIQAFVETHQGFKLTRLIIEAFGERGADYIEDTWANVLRSELTMRTGSRVSSAFWVATRAAAERQGGALLPMFVYRPPHLGLAPAQQDVLKIALTGATDTEIAKQLGIPVPALKARWSRIFRRVAASELGSALAAPKRNGTRGRQTRHIVVEYVRRHPSELTPFDWSSEISTERRR